MRVALGVLFACAIFSATGAAARDERCAPPTAGVDDWPLTTAAAVGFDEPALCTALSEAAGANSNLHGVVVARRGRLVAELYRRGPDRPIDVLFGLANPFGGDVAFGPGVLHDTRSVSKSVVGLLFGIALAEGVIAGGLEQPALAAFPELADLRTPDRDAIRLSHLLAMTSGLDWDEDALPNDETRLFWKADPVRFLFDRRLVTPPGAAFHYNSGGTAALAELLTRATSTPLPEYARARLFEPLGISSFVWATDLRGRPLAFTGLRMRPRDMAKLGQLVLQRGRWNDRQLVPEAWIEESTRTRVATGFGAPGYGYQWWTGRTGWRDRDVEWVAAFGNGGQRIFLAPALEIVVVTTAGEYGSQAIVPEVARLFDAVVASVSDVAPGLPGAAPRGSR